MPPALLDTDILSELLKLRNPSVRQKALAYTAQHGRLAFSAITRYEICRGYKALKATAQLARFQTVLREFTDPASHRFHFRPRGRSLGERLSNGATAS